MGYATSPLIEVMRPAESQCAVKFQVCEDVPATVNIELDENEHHMIANIVTM